jgi:hypothetical protein
MNTEEQRAKIRASWEKKATPGPVNRFLGEIFNVPIVILAFLVGVFAVGGGAVNLHFHPAYIVESFVCVAAPAVLIDIFYSLYLLWKKRFRGSVPFFILWAIISFVGNIYVINMLADTSPATPKLADIILDYGPQCGKGSKGCIQIVLPDSFPLPFHITDNESVYTVDRYTNPIKLGLTKAIVLTH